MILFGEVYDPYKENYKNNKNLMLIYLCKANEYGRKFEWNIERITNEIKDIDCNKFDDEDNYIKCVSCQDCHKYRNFL